jgi:hypothetical protein
MHTAIHPANAAKSFSGRYFFNSSCRPSIRNNPDHVPQTQAAQTPAAEEALPESWLDGFKWKALVRLRPESRGNFDFDKKTDDNAEYVGQKIQFGFEKDFFDDMSANVVVQDSRVWGSNKTSSSQS